MASKIASASGAWRNWARWASTAAAQSIGGSRGSDVSRTLARAARNAHGAERAARNRAPQQRAASAPGAAAQPPAVVNSTARGGPQAAAWATHPCRHGAGQEHDEEAQVRQGAAPWPRGAPAAAERARLTRRRTRRRERNVASVMHSGARAPRRAAPRTFRPSLSSRRPSSPRWHTTLGSDSLGDPALDIRPAQRTKAASRRLHGVTRRTWGPRRRFCAADTRAPTGPGRRRLFELRVVVRRTNAQLMVPRTDSRRSNTAFVFTGGGHARTRNERGGVQRMRSSERSAWRPPLPRRCSLIIQFEAHPIMDFVVFQRDVVLVDSVPEAGVANHALG